MSILASRFRDIVSKSKNFAMKTEAETGVGYSSGYLSFDFLNGTMVHVKSDDFNFSYYSIGIQDGSMVMFIGRSGCGKTTLAVQMAGNIIRPFSTSCIFHDDIEGGISDERLQELTKMNGKDFKERYIRRNTGITAENFYERLKLIHDEKVNNRDLYEYDTNFLNCDGTRLYKLEPTVYILDSIALLMPEKYASEDELSGQMSSTAAARCNAMVFKRIIPMLKSANIILLTINHINQKVELTPAQMTKNQLSYLKKGETLPGGNSIIYLSNLVIRVDDATKIKETDPLGVFGHYVDISLVKSRSTTAGLSIPMVLTKDGFDQDLSLFLYMKQNNKINGNGAYLYFGNADHLKFSQKNFKTKLYESEEFRNIFMEEVLKALKESLDERCVQIIPDTYRSVTDDLLTMINEKAA